jgi:UDP-N-acetylglucosamine 2-epimerase (non-hydrolysing)
MTPQKINSVLFFGTSAELIKIWPLITELEKKTKVSLLTSNQQPVELRQLEESFGLKSISHLRSQKRGNLVSKAQVFPWLVMVIINSVIQLRKLKSIAKVDQKKVLVFVHGDTMTCVIGALAGRLSRCEVVHVEAGLRSHDWRNPFPEEINRVIVARLAQYHFAPDQIAVANLEGRKGKIVNTHGNTARDSMRIMREKLTIEKIDKPYTLVSLHRAELLANKQVLIFTVEELVHVAKNHRMVMVVDALTRNTLEALGIHSKLQESNIELNEKMPYPDFLKLVIGAERVITDSGGLQEECGDLGIPCLVHRKATERFDGIGTTSSLSLWEERAITNFVMMDLGNRGEQDSGQILEKESPTAVIIESLNEYGLL